jgi:hypothetical protein
MELLDLLWVAVPAAAGEIWWWRLRRTPATPPAIPEVDARLEPDLDLPLGPPPAPVVRRRTTEQKAQFDALVVPTIVTRSKRVTANGLLGEQPIGALQRHHQYPHHHHEPGDGLRVRERQQRGVRGFVGEVSLRDSAVPSSTKNLSPLGYSRESVHRTLVSRALQT